jgi:hypothetical protein
MTGDFRGVPSRAGPRLRSSLQASALPFTRCRFKLILLETRPSERMTADDLRVVQLWAERSGILKLRVADLPAKRGSREPGDVLGIESASQVRCGRRALNPEERLEARPFEVQRNFAAQHVRLAEAEASVENRAG